MTDLIREFERRGIHATFTEVADILWLAEQWGLQPETPPDTSSPESPDLKDDDRKEDEDDRKDPGGEQEGSTPEPTEPGARTERSKKNLVARPNTQGAEVVRIGGARALRDPRAVARALRPLKLRVPSRRFQAFDEEATVRRIAEEGIWLPVFTPVRGRMLELALVVDTGPTMEPWSSLTRELRGLLAILGCFDAIRVYRLDATQKEIVLRDAGGRTEHRFSELIDATGRTAVVVVSDCVGEGWYGERIGEFLDRVGRAGPAAILQVLPARSWRQTALGSAKSLRVSTRARAVPNAALDVRNRSLRGPSQNSIPIPVVDLFPPNLRAWSRVVAGQPGEAAAVAFPRQSRVPPAPGDPEAAARAFIKRDAQSAELAVHLARIGTINVPVMTVLLAAFRPDADPLAISELLSSGLLIRSQDLTGDGTPWYDFNPGIRGVLESVQSTVDASRAAIVVGQYLERRHPDLFTFTAEALAAGATPLTSRFAQVSGLGGNVALSKTTQLESNPKATEPLILKPDPAPVERIVFVSGSRDVVSEKTTAYQAIDSIEGFRAVGLGHRTDETSHQNLQRTARESDIFIAILGGRYGGGGVESEYEAALAAGRPRVAFLKRFSESELSQAGQRFRRRLQREADCYHYDQAEDLHELIPAAFEMLNRFRSVTLQNCTAHAISWAPDGTELIVAAGRYLARVRPGGEIRYVELNDGEAVAVGCGVDRIVIGQADGGPVFLDRVTERWQVAAKPLHGEIEDIALGSGRLAVCGRDGGLAVYQENSDTLLMSVPAKGAICVATQPKGDRIAVGYQDGHLVQTSSTPYPPLLPFTSHPINDVVWNATGDQLAVASSDRTVRVLRQDPEEILATLQHTGEVVAVSFSSDGRVLASMQIEGTVSLWSTRNWDLLTQISGERANYFGGLEFHPENNLLAISNEESRDVRLLPIDVDRLLANASLEIDEPGHHRPKVFISGSYDIGEERGLARAELTKLAYQPQDFEDIGGDRQALLQVAAESEIFLLILGNSFGEGRVVEEYEAARSAGRRCVVFQRKSKAIRIPNNIEMLRRRLAKEAEVFEFEHPDEIPSLVRLMVDEKVYDVFLSYRAPNRPWARLLATHLTQHRLRYWVDEMADMGEDFGEAVTQALTKSRAMIFLLSEDSDTSTWLHLELDAAAKRGIPIFPFRVDNSEPFPLLKRLAPPENWIDTFEGLDTSSPPEERFEQFAQALANRLGVGTGELRPPRTAREALFELVERNGLSQISPEDLEQIRLEDLTEIDCVDFLRAVLDPVQTSFEGLLDFASTIAGVDYAQLFFIRNEQLQLAAGKFTPTSRRYNVASWEGAIGRACRAGQTVYIPDVQSEPTYISARPSTLSELVIPLPTDHGRPLGVLNFESRYPHAFDQRQISCLERLAAAISEWEQRRNSDSQEEKDAGEFQTVLEHSSGWSGVWWNPYGEVYGFYIYLSPTKTGQISWTLWQSDSPELQRYVGRTGTEFIEWTYDLIERRLEATGISVDSPELIATDQYLLHFKEGFEEINGTAKSYRDDWRNRMIGFQQAGNVTKSNLEPTAKVLWIGESPEEDEALMRELARSQICFRVLPDNSRLRSEDLEVDAIVLGGEKAAHTVTTLQTIRLDQRIFLYERSFVAGQFFTRTDSIYGASKHPGQLAKWLEQSASRNLRPESELPPNIARVRTTNSEGLERSCTGLLLTSEMVVTWPGLNSGTMQLVDVWPFSYVQPSYDLDGGTSNIKVVRLSRNRTSSGHLLGTRNSNNLRLFVWKEGDPYPISVPVTLTPSTPAYALGWPEETTIANGGILFDEQDRVFGIVYADPREANRLRVVPFAEFAKAADLA